MYFRHKVVASIKTKINSEAIALISIRFWNKRLSKKELSQLLNRTANEKRGLNLLKRKKRKQVLSDHRKQSAAKQMACSNESGAEISSESDESSLLEEIFSFDLTDDLENPFPCATEAQ